MLGWDKLMETLKKRLEEQKGRHQGGSKWIGTGGTRPSATTATTRKASASAARLAGNRSAVKVWDQREYQQPRRHGRTRHAQHQGRAAPPAPLRARGRGRRTRPRRHHPRHRAERRLLDIQMRPGAPQQGQGAAVARHRRLDGRPHQACARSCSPPPRPSSSTSSTSTSTTASTTSSGGQPPPPRRAHPARDVMHKYGEDYKLIFVGDATMSPYEILQPGGASNTTTPRPAPPGCSRLRDAYPTASGSIPSPSACGNTASRSDHPRHHRHAHVPADPRRPGARRCAN